MMLCLFLGEVVTLALVWGGVYLIIQEIKDLREQNDDIYQAIHDHRLSVEEHYANDFFNDDDDTTDEAL